MNDILRIIESLKSQAHYPNGLSALNGLGFISCANAVHIKHVPFYQPCIILVLAGRKMFFHAGKSITCDTGHVLTVPAPASFDLKNEPDTRSKQYRALIIPFAHDLLVRLEQAHNMAAHGRPQETACFPGATITALRGRCTRHNTCGRIGIVGQRRDDGSPRSKSSTNGRWSEASRVARLFTT